jgi:hypothetical protein
MKNNKGKDTFKFLNEDDLEQTNVLYCIENTVNGNKYVGMTKRRFIDRMNQHMFMHSKQKSSDSENRTTLYKDFEIYGLKAFHAYVLMQNDDTSILIKEEDRLRSEVEEYYEYAKRDLNRDTSRKVEYSKIICTSLDGKERLEFKTQAECGRHFDCHRTNVKRALRGEYNLKKKWRVTYG